MAVCRRLHHRWTWTRLQLVRVAGVWAIPVVQSSCAPSWFQNPFSNLCELSALTQSQETSEFGSSDSHVRALLEEFEDHVTS